MDRDCLGLLHCTAFVLYVEKNIFLTEQKDIRYPFAVPVRQIRFATSEREGMLRTKEESVLAADTINRSRLCISIMSIRLKKNFQSPRLLSVNGK